MPEKEVPVRTVMVVYMCDDCGKEEMESTGKTLLVHPPKYEHRCLRCGHLRPLKKAYPSVEYRGIKEDG